MWAATYIIQQWFVGNLTNNSCNLYQTARTYSVIAQIQTMEFVQG